MPVAARDGRRRRAADRALRRLRADLDGAGDRGDRRRGFRSAPSGTVRSRSIRCTRSSPTAVTDRDQRRDAAPRLDRRPGRAGALAGDGDRAARAVGPLRRLRAAATADAGRRARRRDRRSPAGRATSPARSSRCPTRRRSWRSLDELTPAARGWSAPSTSCGAPPTGRLVGTHPRRRRLRRGAPRPRATASRGAACSLGARGRRRRDRVRARCARRRVDDDREPHGRQGRGARRARAAAVPGDGGPSRRRCGAPLRPRDQRDVARHARRRRAPTLARPARARAPRRRVRRRARDHAAPRDGAARHGRAIHTGVPMLEAQIELMLRFMGVAPAS